MPRSLKLAAGLFLLLVLAAGGYYARFVREIAVQTIVPESNVEVRVFGIGTVEAQTLSRIGFQVSGKVVALHADQGDFVKAGALLAKLDDDAQRAKLAKSEAMQKQAAANLAKAEAQRNRVEVAYKQKQSVNLRRQTLAGRGAVSSEAAEDAQSAEDIARSDVKVVEAEALIAAALQDDAAAQQRIDAVLLAQHELRAPFDARVIARHKELGSIASAGEAAFTLVAPESIWVKAYVDEALAGGLAVGQKAFVRLRSEANSLYEAEVVRIDQESDRTTEERRIYVRCRECSPGHQLRFLGEQAEVEIVKQTIARGLFIPLKFVERYDGRSGLVWTVQDGRLAKRDVTLGQRLLDGRVEIVSPPAAVVADPRNDLHEGRAARAAGGP